MPRLTAMDEQLCHQLPEPFPNVQTHHPHWRESYFWIAHPRAGLGDVVILTMASYPQRGVLASLQMGRVDGVPVLGVQHRPYDGDPHTTVVGGVRVEIVRPYEEIRLFADPAACSLGLDLVWRARTQPYGLRRGTMRAGHELIWDQSHMFQSGTYEGSYTVDGVVRSVSPSEWWGQRDHSWGIRDHGRCPLWLWFQVQLEDGFLGVWHWEYVNGARVYTDGCWAGTDRSEPVPLVDFTHDMEWVYAPDGPAAYGAHGESVVGLRGTSVWTLASGEVITITADGEFSRPYEPFQRGGLNQMRVQCSDGRSGTAIYEVTGSHHHRYFPETEVAGVLPS